MPKLTVSSNLCDFYTTLKPPIQLDFTKDYETAFLSLSVYNSLPNITEENNKFKYSSDKGNSWKIITLSKGAYELNDINAEIQKEMFINSDYDEENNSFYINIDFHKPTFKTLLEISNENYMVDFGIENSIAYTLGFTNERFGVGVYASPNVVNIEKVNSILIHCDFVLGSYVNESQSNVIYSFTPKVGPGYKIIEHPKPELHFLPMVKPFQLDQYRIWLTDQNNKPIDLMGEIMTIDILIREKK